MKIFNNLPILVGIAITSITNFDMLRQQMKFSKIDKIIIETSILLLDHSSTLPAGQLTTVLTTYNTTIGSCGPRGKLYSQQ